MTQRGHELTADCWCKPKVEVVEGAPVKDTCDGCGLRKQPTSYDREFCTCEETDDDG